MPGADIMPVPVVPKKQANNAMQMDVDELNAAVTSILPNAGHNGESDIAINELTNGHEGVQLNDAAKQKIVNGHVECIEKHQIIMRDSLGRNLKFDIFNSCEQLSLKNFAEQNSLRVKEISNVTTQVKRSISEAQEYSQKVRGMIESKRFLFMTAFDKLKSHPSFAPMYNSMITNAIRRSTSTAKPDAQSSESPTQPVPDGLEVLSVVKTKTNLPPAGEFKRKELFAGAKVYVMKQNQVGEFGVGTILSIRDSDPEKLYKIRIENAKSSGLKLFNSKQLAYMTPPEVIAPVGTRICARYSDGIRTSVYAGIIAEPPKITNNERYLIFFDDGYAQYIHHQDIFVMCAQSNDVADDVHENLKEFIRAYLLKYPERPMVKLQKNQVTKTEYECKWWDTRVLDIDASMVKMYFIESQRTEWIYRGSTRLKLLYNELANAEAHRLTGKHRRHNIVPRKPHQPYVEYTREEEVVTIDSDESETESSQSSQPNKQYHPRRKTGGSQFINLTADKPVRNTARKQTSQKPRSAICNLPLKYRAPDIKSHLGYKEMHRMVSFTKATFKPHLCSFFCREKENPADLKGKNPLLIPIILGWERLTRKFKKRRNANRYKVMYRTPCGKYLRSLQDILTYLTTVSSRIPIDFFSVETSLLVFRTFRAKEVLYETADIAMGNENVPIACINSWSDDPPPFVEYESQRFPGKNVNLNLNKEFLCGCTCTDNCQTPEKCECQQITYYAMTGQKGGVAGYKYRRLKEPIITGIYECNSRCKCGPQCGNRVVQNGLQVRLQMFKTERKGWGIRCLDDLDAGQFICIYAGQLLTDQGADEDGNQFGDEYLAELDHIEVVEKTKEGYESDVSDLESSSLPGDKNDNKSEPSDDDPNDPDASFSSDENDSDFDPHLRSTAATCLSTRGSKKKIGSSSNSSISTLNDDSESETKKTKGLPDISSSSYPFTIIPRPLSPESAEILDKIEFSRTPKLSENDLQTVAKKSLTSKHTGGQLSVPVKETRFRSIRSYFGEESCYIMDAKSKGNIGRYLNHSCAPNVFVQNVFVDTHDLRFPAIAFFSMHYILAGTELTWDYNYEVGTVKDKVMYCYCDARNCRGRLL